MAWFMEGLSHTIRVLMILIWGCTAFFCEGSAITLRVTSVTELKQAVNQVYVQNQNISKYDNLRKAIILSSYDYRDDTKMNHRCFF